METDNEATPGLGPFFKTRSRHTEPPLSAPLFSFPTPVQTDQGDDLLSEDGHQYSPSAITERPELRRAGRRGRKSTGFGAMIGPGGEEDMSVSPEPEQARAFSVSRQSGGALGGQQTDREQVPMQQTPENNWHRDDLLRREEEPIRSNRQASAGVVLARQRERTQAEGYRDSDEHRVRGDNASEAYAALLRPALRGEAEFASVLGGLHDLAQDLADRRGEMAAAQTR